MAKDILYDSAPLDLKNAMTILSQMEEEPVSESSGWAWEVWHRLCAEGITDDLSKVDLEAIFKRGLIATQVHHWVEVTDRNERYIVDVAPPDVYSGPMLIGPRSPLALVYQLV